MGAVPRKVQALKLMEAPVEKYGVDEADIEDKTAAIQIDECPRCHAKLRPVQDTGVLLCPTCGSRPFEQGGAR